MAQRRVINHGIFKEGYGPEHFPNAERPLVSGTPETQSVSQCPRQMSEAFASEHISDFVANGAYGGT